VIKALQDIGHRVTAVDTGQHTDPALSAPVPSTCFTPREIGARNAL
jgi:hypothetical protein